MTIKYDEFEVFTYTGTDGFGYDEAVEFLGMEECKKGEIAHITIKEGKETKRYRFRNCDRSGGGSHSGNRPFRMSLAKRYRDEILRNKWKLNGETMIVDTHGKVGSGQHRAAGVILAENLRKKESTYYRDNYGIKGPVSIPALVVYGVDPDAIDTVDIGQKRSAGDVLFRRHEFNGKDEKEAGKLSNLLGQAIRLIWIRTGGKLVSDAPYFLHSVMLDELEKHEQLKETVDFILSQDGEKGEKRISQYLSLPYAAALCYLFGSCETNREKWENAGFPVGKIDWSMAEWAEKFFETLASVSEGGADKKADAPLFALVNLLNKRKGTDADLKRDAKVAVFIKTWQAWMEDKEITAKDLTLKAAELADLGSIRIGGLDVIPEVEEVEEETEEEETEEEETGDDEAEAKQPAKRKRGRPAGKTATGKAQVKKAKSAVQKKAEKDAAKADEEDSEETEDDADFEPEDEE